MRTLYTNNICNILEKYEILCNVSINDIIREGVKRIVFKDYLLTIEMNRKSLFLAAEQGSSKYSNDILVIPNPKCKYNAREWISNTYSKLNKKDSPAQLKISF